MSNARGYIELIESSCTSCMICARECPDWCIHIESHTETVTGTGRPKVVKVLDEFTIDWGLCMFCGICVEVCPYDALAWSPHFDDPAATSLDLRHGRDRLGTPPSGS